MPAIKDRNRVIVDLCHRFNIRDLVIKHEVIRPGQITTFHIHPLPFTFRAFLDSDWGAGWIEIMGGVGTRWEIHSRPLHHLKHLWDDAHFFILGHTDKHPCRELLITKDLTRAGTRLDLNAHHQSTHADSRTRRLKARELIFAKLLIHSCRPGEMDRCFVPHDGGGGLVGGIEPKAKGKWWATFWQRWKKHHPCPDLSITPVRRPSGIRTSVFYDLLNRLNRHHIKAGRIKSLRGEDRSGKREIAAINSIFRRQRE
jgi:hypothetical protein